MSRPAPRLFPDPSVETPTQRDVRLAWERERLSEAERSVAAGDFVEGEELDAWLAAWAAGERLPEDR